MPKFVLLDSHALFGEDCGIEAAILKKRGIDAVIAECKTNEEIVKAASDADAVGIVYAKMDGRLMDALKKCKALVRYGAGYDNIVVQDATERGIAVCNLPDYCQSDVATHTLGLIIDLCRKITLLDRRLREGKWDPAYGYSINRLSSLKLGLVGFGIIARELAQYVKPFNMEIMACDLFVGSEVFSNSGVKQAPLNEVFSKADIISLHLPLNSETKHIVNKQSIAKMKDGVIIINTARGALVSLDDITAALKSGKVKAVGFDATEGEPDIPLGHPIFGFENAVINPHCAYNSVEAVIERHEKAAKSVIEILGGSLPYNCVNKKALQKKRGK